MCLSPSVSPRTHSKFGALYAKLFVLVLILVQSAQADLLSAEFPFNKKPCVDQRSKETGEPCTCISHVRKEIETECCCIGREVTAVPANLTHNLRSLTLFNTGISSVELDDFRQYEHLEELEITLAPELTHFEADALKNLTLLRKITIQFAAQLKKIEGILMENNPKFHWLLIRNTGLEELPALKMGEKHSMDAEIDLSLNQIRSITSGKITNLRARTLKISKNKLERIGGRAFAGSSIHNLELDDNHELSSVSPLAFQDVEVLNNVDLSKTSITRLPSIGMNNVKLLILKDVPTLKELPPVTSFEKLTRAMFTYPHHCCLFKHVSKQEVQQSGIKARFCKSKFEQNRKVPIRRFKRESGALDGNWAQALNAIFSEISQTEVSGEENEEEYDDDEQPPFDDNEIGASKCEDVEEMIIQQLERVHCDPQPDAMNPCENIVGFLPLRYIIWLIWTLSVIFNVIVWVMLAMAYESRLRSHYIFMFNLSFANALSAVYLGFLAVEDQLSADEYFRFAVNWQTGIGCSTAGFLCVFSSLLSILSMFFIAFEIAYSTRQAIYGRHLPFSVTIGCVIFSYVFSAVMAALPLFGVSSYSTTSTCLPLYVGGVWDRVYVIFGLSIIVIAFIGMVICYGGIFRILFDKEMPTRPEDTHHIIKMMLLIVSDLICWMPSVTLGLTAAFGFPLISISVAKIFIVCFFPVNTFTNPFLYVFLTKVIQRKVKKKAIPIIRRLEHSAHKLHSFSSIFHYHHDDEDRHSKKRKSEESNNLLQIPSHDRVLQLKQSKWIIGDIASSKSGSECSL